MDEFLQTAWKGQRQLKVVPNSSSTLLNGGQEGHPACKKPAVFISKSFLWYLTQPGVTQTGVVLHVTLVHLNTGFSHTQQFFDWSLFH